jgi:hypothetical protein
MPPHLPNPRPPGVKVTGRPQERLPLQHQARPCLFVSPAMTGPATGASPARLACVLAAWEPAMAGVLRLPSGRLVRGRGLRRRLPAGPEPTFGLYLLARRPPRVRWEARWIRWPDFWLPSDPAAADALREAWARAENERVEVACTGGHGRTGTALACLAVLDGLPGRQAVAYVRQHYAAQAAETPWQRRYVARFCNALP